MKLSFKTVRLKACLFLMVISVLFGFAYNPRVLRAEQSEAKFLGSSVYLPETAEVERELIDTLGKEKTVKLKGQGYTFEQYAYKVLELVNIERAKESLPALTWNKDMADYAKLRAQEIAYKFSHTRPNGSRALDPYNSINGENIAFGNITPEATVQQWMESQGHRENILRPTFKSMSVGVFNNQTNNPKYWVQLFSNAETSAGKPAGLQDSVAYGEIFPVLQDNLQLEIRDENYNQLQNPLTVTTPQNIALKFNALDKTEEFNLQYNMNLNLDPGYFDYVSSHPEVASYENGYVKIESAGSTLLNISLPEATDVWSFDWEINYSEELLSGWVKRGDDVYYYRAGEALVGLQKIGKTVYLFDNKGVRQYGWHVLGGVPMYFNPTNGGRWTGLRKIGNTTYLLDAKRGKLTGWHVINNIPMYFNPANGGRLTGLRKIGKTTYLLHGTKGKLTGWHVLNGRKHYFSPAYGGGMVTGLRKVGTAYYYFDTEEGYAYTDRWLYLAGKYHYFNSNGIRTKVQTENPHN